MTVYTNMNKIAVVLFISLNEISIKRPHLQQMNISSYDGYYRHRECLSAQYVLHLTRINLTCLRNTNIIHRSKIRREWKKFYYLCISIIALDYGLDDQGNESREGLGIFLIATVSRPTVGPTQPPIQSAPERAIFLGVKRMGRDADHSPQVSAEVKNAWYNTSTPPIHLHGVVLS
jgi:hypothetical protein